MTWGVTNSSEKPTDKQKQVSNVSGGVPVMTKVTKTPTEDQIQYSSKTAYLVGISKVIGGILCFLFGLLQCYSLVKLHLLGKAMCGYGEVSGLIFITTGAVAISASKHKTERRIAATLGLSFIAIIVSAAVWIWMIYFWAAEYGSLKASMHGRHRGRHHKSGSSHESPERRKGSSESHERNGSPGGSHGRNGTYHGPKAHHGPHGSYHGSHGHHGSHERHERSVFSRDGDRLIPVVFLASTIFIFVLLATLFVSAVVQAVVCYRALKNNRYRVQENGEDSYIVPFKTKEKMMAGVEDLPKITPKTPDLEDDVPKPKMDNFYV